MCKEVLPTIEEDVNEEKKAEDGMQESSGFYVIFIASNYSKCYWQDVLQTTLEDNNMEEQNVEQGKTLQYKKNTACNLAATA